MNMVCVVIKIKIEVSIIFRVMNIGRNAQFSSGYESAIKSSVGPGDSPDGGPVCEPREALTISSLGRPFER